jgi:hypothetical protein
MRHFQWIPLASQDIRRKVPIAFFVSPPRTLRRLLPAIGADDFCPSARTARSQIGTGCNRLNVESLPGTIPTAILKKVRPLAARLVSGERGRLVFSSSGDPIRVTGTKVAARDSSLVSTLVFSVSGAAESLFATLFPSDCRLCGTHLVDIYRLSVCLPCLYSCCPHAQRPVAIVPLPLHARKLRRRGSRPVRTNGSGGAGNCRAEWPAGVALWSSRTGRETHSRTRLRRHQRRENICRAFGVATPGQMVGRNALVVDEVFTAGTTVSEWARSAPAGASKRYVATVARTLKADATGATMLPRCREDEEVLAAAI